MIFNPKLNIGDEITNGDLVKIFKCGNMGGMRRAKKTNTLVLISDNTKGLYQDVWKDGILYYTGMGKVGDQVLQGNQNVTLYNTNTNGVEVHLFEVLRKSIYTYKGIVTLANKPYKSKQEDDMGNMRNVWIFPIKTFLDQTDIENAQEIEIIKLTTSELKKRAEMNHEPKETQKKETIIYYRDPYLKEIVKRFAEGKCQFCEKEAPFADKNGKPYLEEHHVNCLAEGGSDTIDNVVAICPNCHRKVHVRNDEADVKILEGIAGRNKRQYGRLAMYEKLNK